MAKTKPLSNKKVAMLRDALHAAPLDGYRIRAVHLVPDTGDAADDDTCHTVQLPNGEIHIVCG